MAEGLDDWAKARHQLTERIKTKTWGVEGGSQADGSSRSGEAPRPGRRLTRTGSTGDEGPTRARTLPLLKRVLRWMECTDAQALKRRKRNESVRRRRAARALESPHEEALRRAKDAARKRSKRSALRRPHASRPPTPKQLEKVQPLTAFIQDKTDFKITPCFNPTISKCTNYLTFRDVMLLADRKKWLTDSIIDWHGTAVAAGLGVDRNKVRLISCSTTNILFSSKNVERIKYDHLSKEERKLSPPPSAVEFSYLVFPVCLNRHWLAVSIQPPNRNILVYDTLKNNRAARLKIVRDLFTAYIHDQSLQTERYTTKQINVPDQSNSDDCGVYVADRVAALLGANDGEPTCLDDNSVCEYRARMFTAAGQTMFSDN